MIYSKESNSKLYLDIRKMYSKMFKIRTIVLFFFCITVFSIKCENDKGIVFKVLLVNSAGEKINSFQVGENVRFDFYIINKNNYSIYYKEPSCYPFANFLKVYQKSTDYYGHTQYMYIGKPEIICPTLAGKKITIDPEEEKWIGTIPLLEDYHWPILIPGDYYVGNLFEIVINDEKTEFKRKIYFTIYK